MSRSGIGAGRRQAGRQRDCGVELVSECLRSVSGDLQAAYDVCCDADLAIEGLDEAVFSASRAVAEALRLIELGRARSAFWSEVRS